MILARRMARLSESATAAVFGRVAELRAQGADVISLAVGEPDAAGDKIYNGAMDNAYGVAQLLAQAKAFRALPTPPKRSIMTAVRSLALLVTQAPDRTV